MPEHPPVLHLSTSQTNPLAIAPTSPLVGDYEIVRPIGRGGMAQLFAARKLGKRNAGMVALKMLDAPPEMYTISVQIS